MKHLLTIAYFLSVFSGIGQWTMEFDTITPEDRVLGIIDSIDILSGDVPTSFEGGNAILSYNGLSLQRLSNDLTGFRYLPIRHWEAMTFAALPHLGFSYSFGGAGTQFIRATYQQAFTDSLLLNINYIRNATNGYIRNTRSSSDLVSMQLERKGRRYSFQVRGAYKTDSLIHSGGIVTDTSLNLELAFIPVWKENASSRTQQLKSEWNNYLFFNDTTAVQRWGVVNKNSYNIINHRYMELDTIDRYSWAALRNEMGLFSARDHWYVDARIGHQYWRFNNLGNDYDTSEIDVHSSAGWTFGKFRVKNELIFNLVGGFNAFSDAFSISYQVKKMTFFARGEAGSYAPVPLKRRYLSNYFSYETLPLNNQGRAFMSGGTVYRFRSDSMYVSANINYLSLTDNYLWNGMQAWEQQSFEAVQIEMSAGLQLGKFHVHSRGILSAQQDDFLPEHQVYVRLYCKTRLFNAKRLQLLLGGEGSYISSYMLRAYTPVMDVYEWNTEQNGRGGNLLNAHAFMTIGVEAFRFFVRYENLGAFWNDRTTQEVKGFPIAEPRLRVGITWDFFN